MHLLDSPGPPDPRPGTLQECGEPGLGTSGSLPPGFTAPTKDRPSGEPWDEQALRKVRSGQGSTIVLVGGDHRARSELLQGLREKGRSAGAEVVELRPEEVERGVPYAAVEGLLVQLRPAATGPTEFNSPLAGLLAFQGIAASVRAERSPTPASPSARRAEGPRDAVYGVSTDVLPRPEEVRAELVSLLRDHVSRAPLVMTFDPGEFVDDSSRRWVAQAIPQLAQQGILIAISLEEDEREAAEAWRSALHQLPVRWEHTEALPRSSDARVGPSAAPLPLRQAFHDLPGPSRKAVLAAAVAGPDSTLPLLQHVLDATPEQVTGELEPALRAGILVREGALYRIVDPHLLHDLRGGLPPAELRRLHAAVARGLQRAYPHPWGKVLFRLAEHWSASGAEMAAVPALLAAGQESMRRGAYEEAVRVLERSLSFAQRIASSEGRELEERTYADLALAFEMEGDTTRAVGAYEKALRTARERKASVARWGSYLSKLVRFQAGATGTAEPLVQRVEEAIREANRSHLPSVESELHACLAHRLLMLGQRDEGRAEAKLAFSCAEAERRPAILARATRMMALALFTGETSAEEITEARTLLSGVLESIPEEQAGAELSFALDDLASLACTVHNEALAVEYGERSVRQGRRACSRGDLLLMMGNYAEHQLHAKDLPGATRTLQEIRTLSDRYGLPETHFARQQWMLSEGVRLYLAGDRTEARRQLEAMASLAERLSARDMMSQALTYLVVQTIESGDFASARTYLRRIEKEGLRRALYSMNRELLDAAVAKLPPR